MSIRTSNVKSILLAVTLTLFCQTFVQAQDEIDTETPMETETLPELPVGITSFGGAHCDGYLYVWGGHNGAAHQYYRSGQNATLYRLNIQQAKQWEKVDESSQGRQGLAMVSWNGKLFRLGGFEARNDRGQDKDLHSMASFDMFDPETNEWTDLLPMPEPRSSFDAVVLKDTLYVIGGWAMNGAGETVWSETAWAIDLSNLKPEWQELPKPPFIRRALSVSFQGDSLYVIGGMAQNGPTRKVDVFNTKTGTWSTGPELPGEKGMEGFGNSSFNVGGRVCVTTYGGQVYRLNEEGNGWEKLGTLETGRFFHRLLPIADDCFALVGGANMESGKTTETEVIRLKK